jgi:L-glyceraldehyde 3-phosphate reductase
MALARILRDPRVTSAPIGASKPSQVTENVAALKNIDFSLDKLAAIEAYEQEGGVNLWERPAQDLRP